MQKFSKRYSKGLTLIACFYLSISFDILQQFFRPCFGSVLRAADAGDGGSVYTPTAPDGLFRAI